ncbi:hypothetical protein Pmar_PMAR014252, partial [Perkinsus marinus ATCC 50983]
MDSGKAEESEVIEVYCHVYVSVVFQIRREVGPALHSVMPRTSTQSFCSLGDNEKVCHIRELISLVHGIRLYHSVSADWPGAGLNTKEVLGDPDKRRRADDLDDALQEINSRCSRLKEYIDYLVVVSLKEEAGEGLAKGTDDICYLRQCVLYLRSAGDDIE